MLRLILLLALVIPLIVVPNAQSKTSCTATPFSREEAKYLLTFIPQAVIARRAGSKIEAVNWNPGPSYRKDLFFFYLLLASGSGMHTTMLDNGVIGYFAVNKVTGRVVGGPSGDQTIEGEALMRVQTKLRTEHCINQNLVDKYEATSPGS